MLFFIRTTIDCDVYFSLSPNNFAEKIARKKWREERKRKRTTVPTASKSVAHHCPLGIIWSREDPRARIGRTGLHRLSSACSFKQPINLPLNQAWRWRWSAWPPPLTHLIFPALDGVQLHETGPGQKLRARSKTAHAL